MINMENNSFEIYEYARKRVKQKKIFYIHFMIWFVGSIFIFLTHKIINTGISSNYFIMTIIAWAFLVVLHFIRVFITDSFMNKNWEQSQIDRLVAQQQRKIEQISKENESQNS